MNTLFKIELKKILKSRIFLVCVIALIVVMLGIILAEYQDVTAFRENQAYQDEVLSWQEREQNAITFGTQSLNEDGWYNALQKDQISRRIAIAEYRLANDIPKDVYKNVWWFFNDNAFNILSTLVIVMTSLLASISIAGEYSGHTLRQMLLLPYRRAKLLAAKLLSITVCSLLLFGILFVLGLASGFIFHGTGGLASQVVLFFGDAITTMNMSLYSIIVIALKITEIIFYTTFVLLLCVLTKNVAASAVIASFLAVFSVPVGNFIGGYYPSIFYLPFNNTDFRRYLDFGTILPQSEAGMTSTVMQGITPALSAGILIISIVCFVGISLVVFKKQDI